MSKLNVNAVPARLLLFTFLWVTVGLTSACGKMNGHNAQHAIAIDREVILSDVPAEPHAIIKLADGGFVIVGAAGSAWAVATDAVGAERWVRREPLVAGINPNLQSAFLGAAQLKDGNILVCGYKLHLGRQASTLLIFDLSGKLLTEEIGRVPSELTDVIYSQFDDCFSWDGGLALVGDITTKSDTYGWVIKLDENGAKISEEFYKYTDEPVATTKASPSFVRIGYQQPMSAGLRIYREDPQGRLLAKRDTPGDHFLKLAVETPSQNTSIISYTMGKGTLYTLDYNLRDARPPVGIGTFYAVGGAGYVLSDGSLALFGRKAGAAVAWISSTGYENASISLDRSKTSSFVIDAAVPTADRQFVAARMIDGRGGQASCLALTWITLK